LSNDELYIKTHQPALAKTQLSITGDLLSLSLSV